MENDLLIRLFNFSVETIKAIRELPLTIEYKVITHQLVKSATSAGANYEESQSAVSNADFSNKIGIALKEMRETNYWLRIINATFDQPGKFLTLEKESEELKKILGAIYLKTSKHRES
jgi:four helix bundle protein